MSHSEINESRISESSSSSSKRKPLDEQTVWELAVWKKAEQTKFYAYLKQLEIEHLNRVSEEAEKKEEQRRKVIDTAVNQMNNLQNKLRKKAVELETRENKVRLSEEEFKLKLNNITAQLSNKDEEISKLKLLLNEEKDLRIKDKQQHQKQLKDKDNRYEKLELKLRNFKQEVDDSPITVLRVKH